MSHILLFYSLITSIYIKIFDSERYLSTDEENKEMVMTDADRARDFEIAPMSSDGLLNEIRFEGKTLSMAGRIRKKLKMDRGRAGFKIVYVGSDKYYIQRNDDCLTVEGDELKKDSCKNHPTTFQLCDSKSTCMNVNQKIDMIFNMLCGDNDDNDGYNNGRGGGFNSFDRGNYNPFGGRGGYDGNPSDRYGGRYPPSRGGRNNYGYDDDSCDEY